MNRGADLFFVSARFGFNSERDYRFGPLHWIVLDGMCLVAQRIAGLCFLELRDSRDVSGMKFRDRDVRFALQQENRAEPFGDTFIDVVWLNFGRKYSRIHA